VRYIWYEAKRAANRTVHGIDFTTAERFGWDTATVAPDARHNYGEDRFVALGRIDARIHVLVFTLRGGLVRIISLRKANRREVRRYEESQTES